MFMKAISDLEMGIAIKLASNKYLDDLYDEFMSYNVSDVEVNPKINKRISRKIIFSEWKDVRVAAAKVSKIAVMFACCIISAFFLAAMCITPVRAAFTGAILTWYDEYVKVSYVNNTQKNDVNSELTIKKPTYIPEKMEVKHEDVTSDSYLVKYQSDNQKSILYYQSISDEDNDIWIDDNIIRTETVVLSDSLEATVITTDNGAFKILWSSDYFYCVVTNGLTLDEALKIAESINNQRLGEEIFVLVDRFDVQTG